MTSSEFTEDFSGLNKVHYPSSDRNDFTVVITSVMGQQNYINIKCPYFTMYVYVLFKNFF